MPATLTWADWDVWTDWTDWFGPTTGDVPGAVDLQAVSTLTAGAGGELPAACTLSATSTLLAGGAVLPPPEGGGLTWALSIVARVARSGSAAERVLAVLLARELVTPTAPNRTLQAGPADLVTVVATGATTARITTGAATATVTRSETAQPRTSAAQSNEPRVGRA